MLIVARRQGVAFSGVGDALMKPHELKTLDHNMAIVGVIADFSTS